MNDWIKSSERLPEIGQYVLICSAGWREALAATFDFHGKDLVESSEGACFRVPWGYAHADYWMPIPRPPEK